jgi:predicted RNA-binding Zn-ribbon protein involved in translation (DUF1610 family)
MSGDATPWTPGDPCPNCGGALIPLRRPTDAEKRAAARTDNVGPATLGPTIDSASDDQYAELGDLHRCTSCGYASRVKAAAASGGGTGTGKRTSTSTGE